MQALDRGHAAPCCGGTARVQEAGGHARKGNKGTPILYVEWRQRRAARNGQDNPVLDEPGCRHSHGVGIFGQTLAARSDDGVESSGVPK